MKIAVIGASGYIGSALVKKLKYLGHEVFPVSRGKRDGWRVLGPDCLLGAEAVINVAGDRIDKRWNARNKKAFWKSRVGLAESIQTWIKAMPEPPSVWVNASAIGIYGDSQDEILTENSAAGSGYLAELCEAWEDAAAMDGVRVVHARIGVVLGKDAMAWQKIAKVFSLGLGGRLGSGQQWLPWVHIEDVIGGLIHALEHKNLCGAMNLVAPDCVKNETFTKQLAEAYKKPAVFHAPAFALHIALGGFASALLASHRVKPLRLEEGGYKFNYPSLEKALEDLV